jgi:chemotaxis protein CheD
MRLITVGMADLAVTNDPDAVLVTYALGSCMAVLVHDPLRNAAGMIHYMLPLARITPEKSRERPAMFADTGIPLLFERMYGLGCRKADLVVRLAGGANICDVNGTFEIGKRNYVIAHKLLSRSAVGVQAEDVGGGASRTVRLFAQSGRVTVLASDHGREVEL